MDTFRDLPLHRGESHPRFPWQDEDEPTLLLRKRHWIAFARNLPIPSLMLLAFVVATWLLRQVGVLSSPPAAFLFAVTLPTAVTAWLYLDWQNDFYLVTAKRVLHEEKVILLHQTWEEAPLDKITNTTVTRSLIGSALNFGSLLIHTASVRGSMLLDYLPDPEEVQRVICEQASRLGATVKQTKRESIQEALRDQIPSLGPASPPDTTTSMGQGAKAAELPNEQQGLAVGGNELVWRKHWTLLVRQSFLPTMSLVVATSLVMFSMLGLASPVQFSFVLMSLLVWLVSVFWLWWRVVDWANDLYILTDSLIIDIESKPLFVSQERRQASLGMIQNVSLRKEGLLMALFNYGDVVIQTAGPSGEFTFAAVSDPMRVQREIFRRIDDYLEERQQRERLGERAEMSEWFGVYNQMRQAPDSPVDSSTDNSPQSSAAL